MALLSRYNLSDETQLVQDAAVFVTLGYPLALLHIPEAYQTTPTRTEFLSVTMLSIDIKFRSRGNYKF